MWIQIARQAEKQGVDSLADFVEDVQEVMRKTGKSAAYLATTGDTVLTCDVAALPALFENMLSKRRGQGYQVSGAAAPKEHAAQSIFQWAWASLPFF